MHPLTPKTWVYRHQNHGSAVINKRGTCMPLYGMAAILDFLVNQSHEIKFDSSIAFSATKNMGVDTKNNALQRIIREIWLFHGNNGGHLGRHLEKLFLRCWMGFGF